MQTIVLQSESKSELKLLADLAKKLGIKVKFLSSEDKEDIGLLNAINIGKTGEYIDSTAFLKKLRK